MRKRWMAPVLAAALASGAAAQYSRIEDLAGSVFDRVGVCNGRLQETADEVEIRAKRLSAYLPSGNAFYSKLYNKVLIEGDLFEGSDVKDLEALSGGHAFYGAFNVVSTVYHELGHAEWDVRIEEEATPEDEAFYAVVEDEIVPWIDDHQGHVDKPWLAVQEWHGYFRGKLVSKMLTDWNELLFYNGLDPHTYEVDEGMARGYVRDGEIPPTDFGTLSVGALPGDGPARLGRSYLERLKGFHFEVSNGKWDGNVEVRTAEWTPANGFQDAWWQAIWDHTDHFYCLHDDMASLRERMQRQLTRQLAALREIQEDEWAKVSRQAGEGVGDGDVPGVAGDGGGEGRPFGLPGGE